MSNTDLWDELSKTDPRYTKRFNRAGFQGTAINGTYVAKRLTEAFGPCGLGWRFIIDDERIEAGHKLKSGDVARVHIIRGHIEYLKDGAWHATSQQFGQTTFVGENKNGAFTDEEAPKKSITDCIAKCAVMLGIGADIHLGLFDDNRYVNAREAEERAKEKASNADAPADQEPASDPETAEFRPLDEKEKAVKWCQDTLQKAGKFTDIEAFDKWEGSLHDALDRLCDKHRDLWQLMKRRLTERRKALAETPALEAAE